MREVISYRWKTLWLGKMTATRYYATEEEIKKHHPEAVRIENSRQVLLVPDSEEELAAHRGLSLPKAPPRGG